MVKVNQTETWDTYEHEGGTPPIRGFDVVCTIGHVDFTGGPDGMPPTHAAFLLIAEHGAGGSYSFPTEDGGTIHVTVETEVNR